MHWLQQYVLIIQGAKVFNSLTGEITGKGIGEIYLENSGIEWVLELSNSSMSKLPAPGNHAKIYTWLYHKEDSMRLFGFATIAERTLFLSLISVSGVGPKGALKILSSVTVDLFHQYIETEDVNGLSSLPGLGKKTAQKILLQLKGKLVSQEEIDSPGEMGELINGLVDMGFDKSAAKKVVIEISGRSDIVKLDSDIREQAILKEAIILLSSN